MRKVVNPGVSQVEYDYYYNTAWQVLEIRKGGQDYAYKQYVWSPRYIDTPVVRFRDADNDGNMAEAGTDDTIYFCNLYGVLFSRSSPVKKGRTDVLKGLPQRAERTGIS